MHDVLQFKKIHKTRFVYRPFCLVQKPRSGDLHFVRPLRTRRRYTTRVVLHTMAAVVVCRHTVETEFRRVISVRVWGRRRARSESRQITRDECGRRGLSVVASSDIPPRPYAARDAPTTLRRTSCAAVQPRLSGGRRDL